MGEYIEEYHIATNEVNVQAYDTIQNCLRLIYAASKKDLKLEDMMNSVLREQEMRTDYASIFFYSLPDEVRERDTHMRDWKLKDNVFFFYANSYLVIAPKTIAADAIINFCMWNANKPEKLRPLYEQIREKFNITYPHVV